MRRFLGIVLGRFALALAAPRPTTAAAAILHATAARLTGLRSFAHSPPWFDLPGESPLCLPPKKTCPTIWSLALHLRLWFRVRRRWLALSRFARLFTAALLLAAESDEMASSPAGCFPSPLGLVPRSTRMTHPWQNLTTYPIPSPCQVDVPLLDVLAVFSALGALGARVL